MEENNNQSPENAENENPYLSSNVKDILKRRREDKNKKSKKMNLISLTNDPEINNPENDNENEEEKMIDKSENIINNKNNIELEKKAKKEYKSIYSTHNKLDINYNTNQNKSLETKKNKSSACGVCCKETFFLIINIISFFFFVLSFIKKSDDDIIYYYFIYPINKISLIFLIINSVITSLILILVKVNQILMFHLVYTSIFYMFMYFKYDIINNNKSAINHFNQANCHFFVFFIIMIHALCVFFILYNIAYYFYLSGQYNKNEFNLFGILIDYWESERNIKKLEKYININLDKLITSKGYSHEENIINKKKNNRIIWRIIAIGFIIVLVHILLTFKKSDIFNCDYFNEGLILHDEKINNINDDKYCKFTKPIGFCYMKALTGYFDKYSTLDNCTLCNNYEKQIFINDLKNNYQNSKISDNTKKFGYPLTNNENYYFNEFKNENNVSQFEDKINKEIFDINFNLNASPEAILDYSDSKIPQLKINVQYNKELAYERKRKQSDKSLFKNVFVLYLSGVSQFYFKNALPRLSSLIKDFSKNSKDTNEKELSSNSYQFTRYHSFTNDSFSNYYLMFYDSQINSIQNIKSDLIIDGNMDINDHLKYFQSNGYITGQTIDTCDNYDHQFKNKNKIFWDHENIAISCDPNYINNIKNNNYCIYGNPFYSYHINYAEQFWRKYKDNKKYFRLSFNSADEKTGSLLTYLDQSLYDLFIRLNFNGLLDNTAIFFISEYGGKQDNILYNFGIHSEKEINMKFGSFFLLLNKNNNLNEEENKMVYNNQNKLMTPFDIYASLVHIPLGTELNQVSLFLDENSKGESVFKNIEGNDRNYNYYKDYWIDSKYCACLKE